MNQKYLAACVGMEPYCIKADAENIAAFIEKYSREDDIWITTLHDYPLLSTLGGFVNRCYDQEFMKNELLPALNAIQLDGKKPQEIVFAKDINELSEHPAPVPDWDCSQGHGIYDLDILKPMHEWRPEETGYTVISADDLKQMNRFDGEDMENER